MSRDFDDIASESAFREAEERCFRNADWEQLVALYRSRLASESAPTDPAAALALQFRLGQILEERLGDADAAIEAYAAVTRNDPSHAGALGQLRRIHSQRGAWEEAVAFGEHELSCDLTPHERLATLIDLGNLHQEALGDLAAAETSFEQALAIDADHIDALAGFARLRSRQQRPAAAAELWERVAERQRAPDRANAWIALGELLGGPLGDTDGATERYRRALSDDPRSTPAVTALVRDAREREQWPLLDDLCERAFNLASDPSMRAGIALDAARNQLEGLGNPAAARLWLDRARQSGGAGGELAEMSAAIERRAGNRAGLIEALQQSLEVAPEPALHLELASLWSESGDEERALEQLRTARHATPNDPEVVAALDACLHRLHREPERIELLEQQVSFSRSPEEKARRLADIARLRSEALEDPEASLEAWHHCFDVDPGNEEATLELVSRLGKSEDWRTLRQVLERACQEGVPERRADWLCQLGELALVRFDDPEAAARAFELALEREPRSALALSGLSQIALISGDEDAIVAAYAREAEQESDLRRLAPKVWELVRIFDARDRPGDAIRWLERLHAVAPDDFACLEALAAQYACADDPTRAIPWTRVLESLASLSRGAAQLDLWKQLCDLEARFGNHPSAIAWAEACLTVEPDRVDMSRKLVDLYRKQRQPADCARVMRQLADLLEGSERASCLAELAVLLQEELDDPEAAIEVLQRHGAADSGDLRLADRLTCLLEQTGRHEELVQHLFEQSQRLGDATEAGRTRALQRAQLLLTPLCRFDQAAGAFRVLHEADPSCPEALAGLEQALRAGRDTPALVRLLADRAARATDPSDQRRLEFERAVLLEDGACEAEDPRDLYQALATQVDDAGIAQQATARLELLLERAGEWQALRDHLERSLGRCDAGERVERLERLGAVCRDRLLDPAGAIAHFEAAGALAPSRAPVWRTLGILYEAEQRPEDLLRVIGAELGSECNPDRQLALRLRAAELSRAQDPRAAAEHCERALELDPSHADATELLLDLYVRTNEPRKRVALFESLLARTEDGATTPQATPDETLERRTDLRRRIAAIYADELSDLDAAIAALGPAGTAPDAHPSLLEPLADLLWRADRCDALIALCRVACARELTRGDHTRWQRRLAQALAGEQRGEEAAAAYETVLRATPDDAEARGALRALYRTLDRSDSLASLLVEQLRAPRDSPDAAVDPTAVHLELATLYEQRLDRPEDALTQLQQVLATDPSNRPVRGRALDLSEQHAPPAVREQLLTAALEHEQEPAERCMLLQRLAQLAWREFDDPERAERTLDEALETDPEDPSVLRALQQLCESTGKATRELSLYEREGALVADLAPERAREAWLRAGAIARDTTGEPERALAAYEAAAALGRLPARREHEWAALLATAGQVARQHEILGRWCDREDSGATVLDHLSLAEQLLACGQTEAALARTQRAARCNPRSRAAWDALAERQAEAGDPLATAEALDQAATLSTGTERCERHVAAALAIEPDDAAVAVQWLEAASAADPEDATAYAQLARIAYRDGDLERAAHAARTALTLHTEADPTRPSRLEASLSLAATLVSARCARQQGHLDAAVTAFEAALDHAPENTEALAEIAEVLDAQGRPQDARPWLERLRGLPPPGGLQSAHWAILGEAFEVADAEAKALEHFVRALEAEPGLARAHAGRVRCLARAGRATPLVEALEDWARASNSEEAAALQVRAARIERAYDREDAARSRLQGVTDVAPRFAGAWCELADLLSVHGEDDDVLEAAASGLRADCDPALAARLEALRAGALERTGRIEEAASAWTEVTRHDAEQSQAALETARLLGRLGRWSAAAEQLAVFAAAHPDPGALELAAVHDERGRLLAGPAENVAAAIASYEQALAIDPARTDSRARLAALLAAIPGRRLDAVGVYGRLLRLEPTNAAARLALIAIAGETDMAGVGRAIDQALDLPAASGDALRSRTLGLELANPPRMEGSSDEAVRRACRELRPAFDATAPRSGSERTGLLDSLREARAGLSASALDDLPDDEFAALVFGGIALSLEPTSPHARTPAATSLAGLTPPRTLRRARRQLGSRTLDELCQTDVASWRAELSALAAAQLLDRGACSLREALEALLEEGGHSLDDEGFSRRVAGCPAARALLARVMARWCGRIEASLRGSR